MAGGHNRRGLAGDVGHARRSWNAVRDDYPRPSLMGNAARALPFPKSKRPTCPFSFAPGGTPPARPSAASAFAGCEPFWHFRCYLDRPPASHSSPRHSPLPGVSLFWRFRCYLDRPHALQSLLRLPSLPGVSHFRRKRLTPASRDSGTRPALWQRAHGNRQPPAMLLC